METVTIKIKQGILKLPDDLAQEVEGQEVFVSRINGALVMASQEFLDSYSDEDIRSWGQADTLDKGTRDKLDKILQR